MSGELYYRKLRTRRSKLKAKILMLVIRLSRVGKKKQPSYRLVVQDKRKDPWGKSFEIVGTYNPRTNPKTIILKEDRIKEWLSKGAQPSATVNNLLVDAKIIAGEKKKAANGDKDKSKAAAPAAAEAK
jgi:small subunit ribosomal protein S16